MNQDLQGNLQSYMYLFASTFAVATLSGQDKIVHPQSTPELVFTNCVDFTSSAEVMAPGIEVGTRYQ